MMEGSNIPGLADQHGQSLRFDPSKPVPLLSPDGGQTHNMTRKNQRIRRAQILATIRSLLLNEGFEGITVRDVAKRSGYAVQTVYNLVGPRDVAITDAIYDFTEYVSWQSEPNPLGPDFIADLFNRQVQAIEAQPEFCRQVCKIYFSDSREVFYNFRDRQIVAMRRLLSSLRQGGLLRSDINPGEVAEDILVYAGAICIEWTDRDMTFQQLRDRLFSGYTRILSSAASPSGDVLCDALSARRTATIN